MTDESRDDAASVAPAFCFSGSLESVPRRQPARFEKHCAAGAAQLSVPRPASDSRPPVAADKAW